MLNLVQCAPEIAKKLVLSQVTQWPASLIYVVLIRSLEMAPDDRFSGDPLRATVVRGSAGDLVGERRNGDSLCFTVVVCLVSACPPRSAPVDAVTSGSDA